MKKKITIPNKQECFYILEMLESGLINYKYIHPWADKLIEKLDSPPSWLCEIAIEKYRGAVIKIIRDYIYSEPFEPAPKDMEKFHIGCLWIKYERGELSWATFLKEAGEYLDIINRDWDCETPYHYLNMHEDSYFTMKSEEDTKKLYLQDHNVTPWINLAKAKFEVFMISRKYILENK